MQNCRELTPVFQQTQILRRSVTDFDRDGSSRILQKPKDVP